MVSQRAGAPHHHDAQHERRQVLHPGLVILLHLGQQIGQRNVQERARGQGDGGLRDPLAEAPEAQECRERTDRHRQREHREQQDDGPPGELAGDQDAGQRERIRELVSEQGHQDDRPQAGY